MKPNKDTLINALTLTALALVLLQAMSAGTVEVPMPCQAPDTDEEPGMMIPFA